MTLPTYFLAHGINSNGSSNVDLFMPYLLQYHCSVVDLPLPVRHTWGVRWTIERDADLLAGYAVATPPYNRHVIAHSHGCRIALEAAKRVSFASMWLFNPAVSSRYKFKKVLCAEDNIHCVYSTADWAVRLGALLPFNHPFGRAGAQGFNKLAPGSNMETAFGHGFTFQPPYLRGWSSIIADFDKLVPIPEGEL